MSEKNNASFFKFIDNTRVSCSITGVGLFVIIWSFIGPGHLMAGSTIGKILGLLILCYAAYNCLQNTQQFVKTTPDIFKNPKLVVERNNVMLSYGYSILIILLALYIIKKIIW